MDLFLACIFICHVNYIKIKANNTAKKYLENNMTRHNVTACPIFWLLNKVCAINTRRSRSDAQFLDSLS